MRLLYTSDLHGNLRLYQELLALACERHVAAVVVGGDLLPHAIALEQAIPAQRAFVQHLRPLLAEFQATGGAQVYLLPGNDDWQAAVATLDALEQDGLLHQLHGRAYALEAASNTWIAGYACVPITPYSIKDYERRDEGPLPDYSFAMAYMSDGEADVPRLIGREELLALPTIAEDLAALAGQSNAAHTLYVCHAPPHDTPLDRVRGRSIGSRALRRFIEEHQPPLTLHGHAHQAPAQEGQYATRIGASWCLNPGADGIRLHAIFLDTTDIAGTLWHTVFGRQTIDHRP